MDRDALPTATRQLPPESVPAPAETTMRLCPTCQSDQAIKPLGRVFALDGVVKSSYRCTACDEAFYFVRKPLS